MNAGTADAAVRPELSYLKTIGGSGSDLGRAVATDPAGNVYVAGTTTSADFPTVNAYQKRLGGAFVRASSDAGKTWTTPSLPEAVYAVAGSAKQPATIFAGTSRAMYKSVDSGKTWAPLPSAGAVLVNALWVDSETPSNVLAATSRGTLRSFDSGATWSSGLGGYVLSLGVSAARSARVFAVLNTSTAASVYRSTDGGTSWSVLKTSPQGAFSVACDTANPDVVYAAAAQYGFSSGGATALYKSDDGGETWAKISDAPLIRSTFTLAAGSGVVFVGSKAGLLRSSDGGSTWTTPLVSPASNVAIDTTRPQNVYADTAAGILASTDAGLTWTSILPVRQTVEALAVAPTTPPTVFVGAELARNLFVTKMSPDGKQTLYSTYLGGSYLDTVTAMAVDREGNAYLTGYTYANDFPVTAGAIQTRNGSDTYTAFLAKLGPNGDTLAYSTYLGGSTLEVAYGIAVDAAANAYITGYAGSADFPVTPGALSTTRRGVERCVDAKTPADAFVTKIDTLARALRYSTFLGGGCVDQGLGIAVDAAGNALVVGMTASPDFPVTTGALQSGRGNPFSGFVAKLSAQGNSLLYSTYLGGPSTSAAIAAAVDAKGAAYVTGNTYGFDKATFVPGATIITTSPAANLSSVPMNPYTDGAAFVVKLDAAGSSRQYLTYLGGTFGSGNSIALDEAGNVWVTGTAFVLASSDQFPMRYPFQAKTGTAFLSQLGPDGGVLFSSLMDDARQVALDASGDAFVAGAILTGLKGAGYSVLLARVDRAVAKAVSVDEPQRIVPSHWFDGDWYVAPGEILAITGSGLGPAQEAGAQFASDGRVATTLAGTKVTFDGVAAPLLSVAAGKIVCIAPFALANRSTTSMRVDTPDGVSNTVLLPSIGSNIEALVAVNADGSANSREHPAAPGSVITIYGAGFGAMTSTVADGSINAPSGAALRDTTGVIVSDQKATVLYAGPAPGQVAGVVQVNFRVPQLAPGSYAAFVGWTPPDGRDHDVITVWIGQP
jgi:uncharacterized protein (TIGR03437 family)